MDTRAFAPPKRGRILPLQATAAQAGLRSTEA